MNTMEAFGLSAGSTKAARRIVREGGEDLDAICKVIELSHPAIYQFPYDVMKNLRTQGMDRGQVLKYAQTAGEYGIALYLDIEKARLDSFLQENPSTTVLE